MSTQNVTQVETQAVHMCVASRPGHVCSAHVLDTCPVCVCLCHAHGDLDRWMVDSMRLYSTHTAKHRPDARSVRAQSSPSGGRGAVPTGGSAASTGYRPGGGVPPPWRTRSRAHGLRIKFNYRTIMRTIEHTVETFGINT